MLVCAQSDTVANRPKSQYQLFTLRDSPRTPRSLGFDESSAFEARSDALRHDRTLTDLAKTWSLLNSEQRPGFLEAMCPDGVSYGGKSLDLPKPLGTL